MHRQPERSGRVGHCQRNGVGLHHVSDAERGRRGKQRERSGQPAAGSMADPVLQEVHRPAALFASGIGRAKANREQRLGVLRRHADQARHPHPEERTGPTRGDRCGHANDVAGADCGGQRRHERLEVGDVAFSVGLAAHNQPEPQCVRELKKL